LLHFACKSWWTRRYSWNTKRPQPPPKSMGDLLVNIAHSWLTPRYRPYKPNWRNLAKSTKRHIYRSRAFHRYQYQMSGPPRFRDIARTRNPDFWPISANLTTTDWPKLAKITKRHIYRSRAFHRYQYQMSGPPRFWDIARTRKRWRTDRQTDRRTDRRRDTPNLYQGWGLITWTYCTLSCLKHYYRQF